MEDSHDNVVDLDEYRRRKEEDEIENLKSEISHILERLNVEHGPISRPWFPEPFANWHMLGIYDGWVIDREVDSELLWDVDCYFNFMDENSDWDDSA